MLNWQNAEFPGRDIEVYEHSARVHRRVTAPMNIIVKDVNKNVDNLKSNNTLLSVNFESVNFRILVSVVLVYLQTLDFSAAVIVIR